MKAAVLWVVGLGIAGTARAEKLVRCEVSLERSVGAVTVPGWGADEGQASARAERAAWSLAWADRQPGLAMGTVAAPADTWRRDAALRKALDPATDWRVPGAVVRSGSCAVQTVSGAKGVAWEARWEREERKVVREDPSVAVEGARRRECWGTWSHRMVRAATAAQEAAQERHAAGYPAARSATDGLFRCMTQVEPDLRSASGAIEGVPGAGPVQCRRPRRGPAGWTAAPGWEAGLEASREAALGADIEVQLMGAERELASAVDLGSAADRAAAVQGTWMGRLASLVVATDLAEQALMSCRIDGPKTVRPGWTPPEGASCAGWPTGAWQAVGPAELGSLRDRTCDGALRAGAAGGQWPGTLGCAASCRADLEAGGWAGRLVWRPTEPSRASVEDAEKLLSAALAAKDYHLLGIATGGLIFDARYAAAFKANPGAFWGSIEQARVSGSWGDLAFWEQVDGAWVLAFRDR